MFVKFIDNVEESVGPAELVRSDLGYNSSCADQSINQSASHQSISEPKMLLQPGMIKHIFTFLAKIFIVLF